MTDTSALRAFIEARLDEDEHFANFAMPAQGVEWRRWRVTQAPPSVEASLQYVTVDDHVRRHDPARVLREVVAKRAILAARIEAESQFDSLDDYEHQTMWATTMGVLDDVLAALAATWSEHPDYRPEWSSPDSVVPTV